MTFGKDPLDPFSEVVDQNRRWTPEWYGWITELAKPPGATAPPTTTGPWILLSEHGVVGDGVTDDTAALNAVFASLIDTGATVVWDVGFCKVTNTIVVGDNTGGGPQSHINIWCPNGAIKSGIKWFGPDTGTAMIYARQKFVHCIGLGIFNQVARNTTCGLGLGGAGFGNQTAGVVFDSLFVSGFHTGVQAGISGGAASEIAFNKPVFQTCDIGFTSIDFNSLDFTFINPALDNCGIGISSGVCSGFSVFGGSASNSVTADFEIGQNSSQTYIGGGFRSETTKTVVLGTGSGGYVVIDKVLGQNAQSPFKHVTGNFASLVVRDSSFDGYIAPDSLDGDRVIEVTGCALFMWDKAKKLPILFPTASSTQYMMRAYFRNNRDSGFPAKRIMDFQGLIGTRYDGVAIRAFYESAISFFPYDLSNDNYTGDGATVSFAITFAFVAASEVFVTFLIAGVPVRQTAYTIVGTNVVFAAAPAVGVPISIQRIDFGFDYLALSHVRQLSEGTIGGATANTAPASGKNLRVQGVLVAGTLAFKFKRTLTTNAGGGSTLTATAGTFLPGDVGKPVFIENGADTTADWYGYITNYLTSTTVDVFASGNSPGGRYPQHAGKVCTIGEDEPDANYMVAGITSNAVESFSVTAIAANGFTVTSSNVASTATFTALIVR